MMGTRKTHLDATEKTTVLLRVTLVISDYNICMNTIEK